MKQVLIIHGGATFPSYEEYLEWLRALKLDDPRERKVRWKSSLGEALGPEYQVIAPEMPNPSNARYEEWKLWLEKYVPFIDDDVTFVGHSLGGLFLAKYLSENIFPKKIKSAHFVAAAYTVGIRPHSDFAISGPIDKIAAQCQNVFFYHAPDDPIVSVDEFKKYQVALPSATFRLLEGRGHFRGETFPEILADIKSLS